MRLTQIGGESDRISPDCVADLDKQIQYLGSMNFVVYFNRQELMVNEFDHDNKLNKYSTITTVQADQYRPTWIEASVSKDLLEDEIALF